MEDPRKNAIGQLDWPAVERIAAAIVERAGRTLEGRIPVVGLWRGLVVLDRQGRRSVARLQRRW
jgi:hypothetical protein